MNDIPAPVHRLVGLQLSDSEIWELDRILWKRYGLGAFARIIMTEIDLILAARPNAQDHRAGEPPSAKQDMIQRTSPPTKENAPCQE
jgi:hypothetical protein